MKPEDPDGVTRRDALKIAAGAALSVPLVGVDVVAGPAALPAAPPAAAASVPRFFTKEEFALLDELTELIIPADGHSPGARAARVAGLLDRRLAEAFLPPEQEVQQRWRDGLRRVDALSRDMNGAAFLAASPEQRVAVLTRMAANEKKPETAEERFFGELKGSTIGAYYTSEIGIHREMEYKGNTLLQEFAGQEPTD